MAETIISTQQDIKDDIAALVQKEEDFFALHGEYFELEYDRKPPPVEGTECKENTFKRFMEPNYPAQELTKIDITPKASDWKFIIGRGLYPTGQIYMITALRETKTGEIEKIIHVGGDPKLVERHNKGNN